MDTESLWKAITIGQKKYPSLNHELHADVAIIGGGITGITAAYELLASHKKIILLERESIGSGTTAYSTGNLYVPVQPFYSTVMRKFGKNKTKIVSETRSAAIDYIETVVKKHNIDCQFTRRPWYLFTNEKKEFKLFDKEMRALQKLNIAMTDTLDIGLPIAFKKAAILNNQARFNPYQYVLSLADHIAEKGVLIYENTRVISILEKKNISILKTEQGIVKAAKVIIATHTPIGINPVQMFTAPYRSYVVALKEKDDATFPEGQWWDLSEPHHALCTHAEKNNQPNLILVAGNHHKTGQGVPQHKHYDNLERYLTKLYPTAKKAYQWSAQHYQTADQLPYIGLSNRRSKNVFIATGYFADGLIYGTIAGQILAKLVLENNVINPYRASRIKPFASAGFLMKENFNVLLQYYKDYLSFKPHQLGHLKEGDGKIVKIDGEEWAVCRDNHETHVVSAVCTHMKCLVHWNDAEKTWDCPCHGSRFSKDGKVLEGPATVDLRKRES